jgi:hypothetical protein
MPKFCSSKFLIALFVAFGLTVVLLISNIILSNLNIKLKQDIRSLKIEQENLKVDLMKASNINTLNKKALAYNLVAISTENSYKIHSESLSTVRLDDTTLVDKFKNYFKAQRNVLAAY